MNEENTNQQPQLTKQERNEQKRAEKEQERVRRIRARQIKKFLTWFVILGVVVGLVYWAVIAANKAEESRPGETVAIQDARHINVGDEHEPYNTNPPTSGAHGAAPNWGVYREEIPDENVVHSLEHGGIWISYKNLNEEDVTKLENIARQFPNRTIVTPREANDSNIAVASWGRLMKLDAVDEEAILDYIRKNTNRSPEQLAR